MGTVKVRFSADSEARIRFGILDHDVTLPDGTVVHNPLRVLRNDAGSEVVFTVYRRDGVSDEDFERDQGMIAADLERLRRAVER